MRMEAVFRIEKQTDERSVYISAVGARNNFAGVIACSRFSSR